MSGSLGSLVVEVAANVARFQSDMGKIAQIAENRAKQIDGALNIVGNSLKALGAAAVVGLTFEKLRGQVQGAIDSAAGLKDLAERTGGTVEKLSGLSSIAKLSGTDVEALAGGIQKLAKAMNEAENGGKAQASAFQAIGISTKDLKGLRPDEVFEKIARRQAEYADGAGKVAVMQALLGKSGANLIPVMNDLAEAGDLQVKVTAEQAEMADTYEKNQKRLAAVHGQVAKVVAMELLPVQLAFGQALLDSATANDGMKKSAQDLAKDGSIYRWAREGAEAIGVLISAADYGARAFMVAGKTIGYVAADATLQLEAMANGLALIKGDKSLKDFLATTESINQQRIAARDAFGGDLAEVFGKTNFSERLKKRLDEMEAARKALASTPGRKAVQFNPKDGEDTKNPGDKFVEQLQRQVLQLERGRGEMLRLEAAQKGVSKEAAPYILQLEEIERRQGNIRRLVEQSAREEEQRAKVTGFVDAGNDAAKQLILQSQAVGMTAREQRRLTELRRVDEAVQRASVGATIETRAELEKIADVMRGNVARAFDELDSKERSWATGAGKAFQDYAESAGDAAKSAENLVSGALQRTEDALVNFAKTGKLSFSDLFAFMAEEYLRQQIRMATASLTTGGLSLGSIFTGGANLLTSALGFLGFGHKDGLSYVPYDGYPAVLHEGERVMTKAENAGQGGGGPVIDMSGAVYNIGQGVSRAEVVAGVKQANAETEARLMRRLRQQGVAS
jgi:lambda family phage tail tape measure protein